MEIITRKRKEKKKNGWKKVESRLVSACQSENQTLKTDENLRPLRPRQKTNFTERRKKEKKVIASAPFLP